MSKSICDKCVYKTFCNLGIETIIAGCSKFKLKRPLTHADKIRAMTDEELAKFQCNSVYACPPGSNMKCIDELYAYGEGPYPSDKQCMECWLNWLRQEAPDD